MSPTTCLVRLRNPKKGVQCPAWAVKTTDDGDDVSEYEGKSVNKSQTDIG
jgi:hypothetical protein